MPVRKVVRRQQEKKIRFIPVFDPEKFSEKIGEVKNDPFRDSHKWTGLNEDGRLGDFETRWEAEQAVEDAWWAKQG